MSKRNGMNGAWVAAGLALLALALVFLAAGCAPKVTVESNVNPEYKADLEKLFVIVDTRKIDDATEQVWDGGNEFGGSDVKADTTNFMKEFLPRLSRYFEEAGVEIKGHAVTGLELSSDAVNRKITDYKPDAVLHIKESWFAVQRDSGILGLGATEDVTAIDLDCWLTTEGHADEAVWRALLQIQAAAGAWKTMADELAISLVDQLTLDGLVDPKSVSTPKPRPGEGEA